MCVCVRERESEGGSHHSVVCVFVYVRVCERERGSHHSIVCVRERERERERGVTSQRRGV